MPESIVTGLARATRSLDIPSRGVRYLVEFTGIELAELMMLGGNMWCRTCVVFLKAIHNKGWRYRVGLEGLICDRTVWRDGSPAIG